MGWTFTHRAKGQTDREWFQNEFQYGPGTELKITDSFKGKEGAVFLRCERTKDGDTKRFIIVAVTKWAPRDPRYNFGYKDMDESMHPYYYDCPLRMLEGLTDFPDEGSRNWRANVRKYHAEKALRPKLAFGDVVKFAEPVNFGGFKADTFEKVRYGKRKNIFRVVETGGVVRITPGYFDRNAHEKVEKSVAPA